MATTQLPRFTAAQRELIEQEQALLGRLTDVMERFPGAAELPVCP